MPLVPLKKIAYGRSGDKGSDANIGIAAYNEEGFRIIQKVLTAAAVHDYFKSLGVIETKRYEIPGLLALNFILKGALAGGGSRSLRFDSQGKALAQALLEMKINIEETQNG